MSFRIEARFGLGIENVHKTADLSKSLWYSKTQLGEHLLYDFLCGFFILYIKKLDDLRNRVNNNKLRNLVCVPWLRLIHLVQGIDQWAWLHGCLWGWTRRCRGGTLLVILWCGHFMTLRFGYLAACESCLPAPKTSQKFDRAGPDWRALEPVRRGPRLHLLKAPVGWGWEWIQQLREVHGLGLSALAPPSRSRTTPLLEYPANRDNLMRLADGIMKLWKYEPGSWNLPETPRLILHGYGDPPRSPVGDKQGNSQHFEKKN